MTPSTAKTHPDPIWLIDPPRLPDGLVPSALLKLAARHSRPFTLDDFFATDRPVSYIRPKRNLWVLIWQNVVVLFRLKRALKLHRKKRLRPKWLLRLLNWIKC